MKENASLPYNPQCNDICGCLGVVQILNFKGMLGVEGFYKANSILDTPLKLKSFSLHNLNDIYLKQIIISLNNLAWSSRCICQDLTNSSL